MNYIKYKIYSKDIFGDNKLNKESFNIGVTGQDGSYLADFLLNKKYEVHGVVRRSSSINTKRIDHIFPSFKRNKNKFYLHWGDVTDAMSVSSLIKTIQPDEIYNLAAQSHVSVSFEIPEYTANADAIGVLRILEAIRFHKLTKKTKFYQAGTSKCLGKLLALHKTKKPHLIHKVHMV